MKYMGSKNRIARDIINVMLEQCPNATTFVDLFCGGCNVSSFVPNSMQRIANDKNKFLVSMWSFLLQGYKFPIIIPKELYVEQRNLYHKKATIDETNNVNLENALIGWVGFMGSYNGRFFDGGYSGHDVNGRNYIGEAIGNIDKQLNSLNNVTFVSDDYDKIDIPQGAIIYCDIPYRNTKQYDTSKGFNYEEFYNWCRQKKKEGYNVFISEYNMPSDFTCIWEKTITNSLNQTKTYKTTEKLFIP